MRWTLLGFGKRAAVLFALVAGGVVAGAALQPAAVAAAACEQDECEGGTRCKDNSGHQTSCSFSGSSCATDACQGDL